MIGEVLRKLRLKAGLTLEQLGERSGLNAAQISRFETGARQPSIDQTQDLASALGVTMATLFSAGSVVRVMGYVGAGAKVEPEFEQVPEGGLEQIRLPFPVPDDVIAFQVRGDSMLPRYDDGDYILVYSEPKRPISTFVREEAIVKTRDGRRYVKVIEQRGGQIDLVSWNARPIEDVDVEWVGQIFAKVSRNSLISH